MAKKPEPEAKRYHVEYLDWAKGEKLMNERKRADDTSPGLWDYVDEGEITVLHACPSKDAAFAWAKDNAKLDVFNMPRVREQTLTVHDTDDRGRRVAPVLVWDTTGMWEDDGTDILEAA